MSEVDPEKHVNDVLDFCLRVGELLLSSGAGAADVSVTMRALANHYELRQVELDVTFASLSMGAEAEAGRPLVLAMRQVKLREIDYFDLTEVDDLVRNVLADEIELAEARRALARIISSGRHRPRIAVTLGWGVMCAGVAAQFGGGPIVIAIAFLSAVGIDRLQTLLARRRLPGFYQQVAGGALATLLVVAAHAIGIPLDPSLVITSSIVMLLAGIGFMGALQDALSGFYITANARVLEAVLATAGIIAGVSAGLSIANLLGVELGDLVPGRLNITTVAVSAVGAAIASAAFAYASHAPARSLLPIAGIGGVAMLIFQLVLAPDVARAWGAGVAAFFVGLVSYGIAGRVKVPPLVVLVPAVVPLLPGVSIYRALSLLASGGDQTSQGLLAMITAGSVSMALAAGVILGEYVAQPIKREARRLENRLAGPRLIGPPRIRIRSRSKRRSSPSSSSSASS